MNGQQTKVAGRKHLNLFDWWNKYESTSLRQWAFDTLSIPAMSAEIERVFSSSKHTIGPSRMRLAHESFKALQCIKHWWDHDILEQR